MTRRERWCPPAPGLVGAAILALAFVAIGWRAEPYASSAANGPAVDAPFRFAGPDHAPDRPDMPSPRAMLRRWSGIERLDQLLGNVSPRGKGVVVAHVEGGRGDYMPQHRAHEFRNVEFQALSGRSRISRHADVTAHIIYGTEGLAPGVAHVRCMAVEDFVGPQFLRCQSSYPPARHDIRLYNHSWAARRPVAFGDLLRRVDYVIDEHDVIMVCGVDNGRDSEVPPALASAHNLIAVGDWEGDSSGGYTLVEGPGRCKPDIVAPGGRTSYGTAVVSAVAARLLEGVGRQLGRRPDVAHSEVVKAVLLAGATKPEGWQPAPGRPLDARLGAGCVDLERSYAMLTAPAPRGAWLRAPYGWHFAAVGPGDRHIYRFSAVTPFMETSLVLVWHRRIIGRTEPDHRRGVMVWRTEAAEADLDLALHRQDEEGHWRLVADSASAIDNVEHIHLAALDKGTFLIVVSRNDDRPENWEYAMAWRLEKPRQRRHR